MGVCADELENVLARVSKSDLEELRKAAFSKDFLKIKSVLKNYVSTLECLNISILTKYVVKKLLIESADAEGTVFVEVPLEVPPGGSMGSGAYPCYTVAEVLYASLFDVDPATAHERMYDLIEPILLSPNFTVSERKAIFLPVTASNWDTIQTNLASILGKLDESRRKTLCSGFANLFHLFLFCFNIKLKGKFIAETYVSGKLFNLCPDLKYLLLGGEE